MALNHKKSTSDIENQFIAITLHELKAPLSNLKWTLEYLANDGSIKLPVEYIDAIGRMQDDTERMLRLVRDLLDIDKMQADSFEIVRKKVDMGIVLQTAVDAMIHVAKEKHIDLRLQKNCTNAFAQVDQVRIRQVLDNLLSNAIKYTSSHGSVTAQCKTVGGKTLKGRARHISTMDDTLIDARQRYCVISISDTGTGIKKKEQQKVFQRFFRSEDALRSGIEGTGLGLHIAQSIINRHGGTIWFTSQWKKGTEFFVCLPLSDG